MSRWNVLAAGAAVVVGAAFVTGASVPPRPIVGPKPEQVKAAIVGQKTGYFNMARVMREYKRAQNAVARLNDRKNSMSANLIGLRNMYTELQHAALAEKLKTTMTGDTARVEEIGRDTVIIARRIEDTDREIGKLLNNQATTIITELHDEIQVTVTEMAKEHGLVAALAYPAPATAEEANSPMVKELRLKPPAAYPFYLDPSVDYTDEVIQRLNAKFAAEGGK